MDCLTACQKEMINIKAKQTKLQFVKNGPISYRYILRPELYSKLPESKVLDEAAAHSGIGRGALKGAWDAIGDVIKNWLTEGHSLPLPGIGTVRFGVNGESVEDVNDVAKGLIKSRKVIYTPSKEIKEALMACNVSITCIDKDGNVVKRVQDDASDETDTTEPENGGNGDGNGDGNGGNTTPPTDENGDGIE